MADAQNQALNDGGDLDAARAAARANTDVLQTQIETAQQAVRSSLEAGISSFDGMSRNLIQALGVTTPHADLAEQSARSAELVSRTSSALAKGARDVARAWFDLPKGAVRIHLEAMGQLASCRSMQDVVALQSKLLRDNLQNAIESGDAMARVHANALQEARLAMRPGPQPAL